MAESDSLNPLLVFLAAETDPDVEIKAAQMTTYLSRYVIFEKTRGVGLFCVSKRWLCDEVPQL